ncbi:MAG: glycine cleavage system protein GcvH [Eubacteriales bacterium]
MAIRSGLKYTKTHEWVEFTDEKTAKIGLTDFAQKALGDLVFVNLPEAGNAITAGESFADVESVKAVSDVYSPVTGTIESVNEDLLDAPENINSAPYDSWFIVVGDITDKVELLDAAEYEKLCAEEA